ncbi:hypothetical protein TELCIR_09769 [Teladorsagia circumcincta]|uniref:Uncharacterized protein n=1 Tax=Teladorsagia circumcincta TaxID=45464 RepID=A0A2G9UDX2_TELCI|nr:hypothetical protein TELCIR_09769 [Teladorsagia circumcincta]
MRTAAVQQGLVHKDPDVDAIFRLLHADKKSGLDEKFNDIAPPVALEAGYFVMADDTIFNFWNEIDLTIAFHPSIGNNQADQWWTQDVGLKAAERVVDLFEGKYRNDTVTQAAWTRFGNGFRKTTGTNYNASAALMLKDGWSVSDLADPRRHDQLYGKDGRRAWHQNYNANLYMMHPIKFSFLGDHRTRQIDGDVNGVEEKEAEHHVLGTTTNEEVDDN